MKRLVICLAVMLAALPSPAQPPDDPILKAMQDEMQRARTLKITGAEQPYYIEYTLHDIENVSASATLGALISAGRVGFRLPEVRVRIGGYQFDDTNFIGTDYYSGTHYDVDEFPIDDDYYVLRRHLWLELTWRTSAPLRRSRRKRAALRNVTLNDQLADFSSQASRKDH